MDHHNLVNTIK